MTQTTALLIPSSLLFSGVSSPICPSLRNPHTRRLHPREGPPGGGFGGVGPVPDVRPLQRRRHGVLPCTCVFLSAVEISQCAHSQSTTQTKPVSEGYERGWGPRPAVVHGGGGQRGDDCLRGARRRDHHGASTNDAGDCPSAVCQTDRPCHTPPAHTHTTPSPLPQWAHHPDAAVNLPPQPLERVPLAPPPPPAPIPPADPNPASHYVLRPVIPHG